MLSLMRTYQTFGLVTSTLFSDVRPQTGTGTRDYSIMSVWRLINHHGPAQAGNTQDTQPGSRVYLNIWSSLHQSWKTDYFLIPWWGCWRLISFTHSILPFLLPSSSNLRGARWQGLPQHPFIIITLAGLSWKIKLPTFLVLDCQGNSAATASAVACENYWWGNFEKYLYQMNTIGK